MSYNALSNHRRGFYFQSMNKKGKRSRHSELDPSVAVAINAGEQPTLTKRRRHLANKKWEATTSRESDSDKIFEDLVARHTKHHEEEEEMKMAIPGSQATSSIKITSNTMLIKSRKSFWKRKLSSLSTAGFDIVWKEARYKFMTHIIGSPDTDSTAAASAPANKSSGAKAPPLPFSVIDRSMSSGGTKRQRAAKSSGRISRSPPPQPSSNSDPVIDLCETSDSETEDVDIDEYGGIKKSDYVEKRKEAKLLEENLAKSDLVEKRKEAKLLEENLAKSDFVEKRKEAKLLEENLAKSDLIEKRKEAKLLEENLAKRSRDGESANNTDRESNNASKKRKRKQQQQPREPLPPKTASTEKEDKWSQLEADLAKIRRNRDCPKKQKNLLHLESLPKIAGGMETSDFHAKPADASATKSRWAKLFFGPDFRTDFVFSLDEGEEPF